MSAETIAGTRVKEKTAASQSGTGTFNMSESAETGYQSFADEFSSGDLVEYVIEGETAGEWEHGLGTWTSATPDTLARTTVLAGSNGTSAVNFTSGQHTVFVSPGARTLNRLTLPVTTHSPTTAGATMVWNRTNQIDISGLTASRNLTIPTPAAGDRMAIEITTGDDTYAGIVIGDTGIDVGGAGAATEWSRLFITGERIVLKARSATVVDVEIDGRIACHAHMALAAQESTGTASDSAYTEIPLDTTITNIGDCVDLTNNRFNARRAGQYTIIATGFIDTTTGSGNRALIVRAQDDAGVSIQNGERQAFSINDFKTGQAAASAKLEVADLGTSTGRFQGALYHTDGSTRKFYGFTGSQSRPAGSSLLVIEEL